MRIDVWMDFNCLESYVTIVKFLDIYKKFVYKDQIDIVYLSYECQPEKDGSKRAKLLEIAQELGIKVNYLDKAETTHLAHELLHLAKKENKQEPVMLALYNAKYTLGLNIANKEILKELVKGILDAKKVDETLDLLPFKEAIALNKENAERRNIFYLPHFRFNRWFKLEGLATETQIKNKIVKMFHKETKTTYCEDDDCYKK